MSQPLISIVDGRPVYTGRPWAELTKEERLQILQIKVSCKLPYWLVASLTNANGLDGKPSQNVLISYAGRHKITSRKRPKTRNASRQPGETLTTIRKRHARKFSASFKHSVFNIKMHERKMAAGTWMRQMLTGKR